MLGTSCIPLGGSPASPALAFVSEAEFKWSFHVKKCITFLCGFSRDVDRFRAKNIHIEKVGIEVCAIICTDHGYIKCEFKKLGLQDKEGLFGKGDRHGRTA